jgi:hypothetical protein
MWSRRGLANVESTPLVCHFILRRETEKAKQTFRAPGTPLYSPIGGKIESVQTLSGTSVGSDTLALPCLRAPWLIDKMKSEIRGAISERKREPLKTP